MSWPSSEVALYAAFYNVEPWGLADRVIEGFGNRPAPEPESLDALAAPLKAALGVK